MGESTPNQPTQGVEDLAAILATLREVCPGATVETADRLLHRCREQSPRVQAETICGDLRELDIPRGVHNPAGWVVHILPRRYRPRLQAARALEAELFETESESHKEAKEQ